MRELAFKLRLQGLIGPRIDLREEVALFDHLAFREADLQIARDLTLHRHGRDRRHGAERIDDDANVARRDGGGADRLWRCLRHGALRGGRRLGCILRAVGVVAAGREHSHNDQPEDEPFLAPVRF